VAENRHLNKYAFCPATACPGTLAQPLPRLRVSVEGLRAGGAPLHHPFSGLLSGVGLCGRRCPGPATRPQARSETRSAAEGHARGGAAPQLPLGSSRYAEPRGRSEETPATRQAAAPRIVGETDSTGSAGVLRGIPTIGRGCSGAIHGTNPVSALLARESRRP
jgi:hypothetical protein